MNGESSGDARPAIRHSDDAGVQYADLDLSTLERADATGLPRTPPRAKSFSPRHSGDGVGLGLDAKSMTFVDGKRDSTSSVSYAKIDPTKSRAVALSRMGPWVIDRLIDWLIDQSSFHHLIDWLMDCSIEWLIDVLCSGMWFFWCEVPYFFDVSAHWDFAISFLPMENFCSHYISAVVVAACLGFFVRVMFFHRVGRFLVYLWFFSLSHRSYTLPSFCGVSRVVSSQLSLCAKSVLFSSGEDDVTIAIINQFAIWISQDWRALRVQDTVYNGCSLQFPFDL